ncbi:MAG: ABC transporter ATP-binding protein/permease [Planctomycetes bacterium]|nr:ABC transporter ATP-binding protein/permease [Planctomycetota bacterium]
MTDTAAAQLEPTRPGQSPQQRQPPIPKKQLRAAFWRTLGLVRPHRRVMGSGILLGFGVALTYAASLGGILPVLKVVVEQDNLHGWLLEQSSAKDAWYAPLLARAATLFPPADAPNAALRTLMILLGGLLAVNVIGNTFRCLSQYLVIYATQRAVMDLRRKMYRKALRVPVTAVSGDLSNTVSQFMSDVREIFLGIVTLFGKVAREPLKALCVLALAIWLDWRLTVVVLAIAPPAVGLLWYFGRKVRKATVRLLRGYGLMLGSLEETLQGLEVVKGYAREGHERKRMWQLERRMLKQQLRLAWIEALSSPLIEVVGVTAAVAGIVWLASRTFAGEIESAQFITMVILLSAMLDPVRKVANVYNMVQRAGGAGQRVFQFLDQPEEYSLGHTRQLRGDGPRAIRFENVNFRYSPDAPRAVSDVTLAVEPGECVAIVGPNGSGKSTLLRLLPRLLVQESGRITIDGADSSTLSLKALREQIAVVTQRPVIFARTVHENIAYGNQSASLDEIRQAARQAFAAEFIEQWPNQYETVLGEFGTSVSGGQRQRIAIARAFLKRSSVLVFDEATSEVDAESERKIHAALDQLRRGKTTFLIAHRHTVMEMAQRLIVMDGGRIIDVGKHTELIKRCPLYVALYRSPVVH